MALADYYRRSQEYDAAISEYLTVAELVPGSVDARLRLASIYGRLDRYPEAAARAASRDGDVLVPPRGGLVFRLGGAPVSNVPMSVRLSTGHVLRVVFPGDSEFRSREELRLAMLEASIQLRRLADRCQEQALQESHDDGLPVKA